MTREEFEKIVEEGLALIPEEFLAKLNNVAIIVDDLPTDYQLAKVHLPAGHVLFGLYEGVPQNRRGGNYGNVLPDKITIFQKNIEAFGQTEVGIRDKVRDTVWHEIDHHFGASEEQVRAAENLRKHGQ